MYQSGARLKFVNVNYLPSENKNTIYIDLCEIAIDSRNCLIKYINFKELPTLQNKTEAYLSRLFLIRPFKILLHAFHNV